LYVNLSFRWSDNKKKSPIAGAGLVARSYCFDVSPKCFFAYKFIYSQIINIMKRGY